MASQPPRLLRSQLTGTVYIVTEYKSRPGGSFEAIRKYSVSRDELAAIGYVPAALQESEEDANDG